MRFDLDDEQRAIQQAMLDLCRSRYEPSASAYGATRADTFWPELVASGWTQLCVPRRFGGTGTGVLELSLVVTELGYSLAPGTYFGNAAAGLVIGAAGSPEQQQRWLPGIASGERRAAFGQIDGYGNGLAIDVVGASTLVLVDEERAHVLDGVPRELEEVEALDITRRLHRLRSVAGEPLPGALDVAINTVDVLIAAELLGVAQHAMERAVDYAQQRHQFGRPIGAYQAVSHRCADMLVLVESARSAVLAAAWTADHEPDGLPFAASVAKVAAADAAWQVTASALQVHGGMGFTWEHPIHLFLRRAAASSRLLRSVDDHLDRVAELHGLGAPGPA
jgi:alkylation response protein AidB-like acyl-CoA dehydrogenase